MRHEQRVVVNARHDRRRVRVDDDLPEGIVGVDRFVDVDGQLVQQRNHGRDSKRVHPVLGFFETDQPPAPGIGLHDGKGEKPQRAVGQRARHVLGVLEIGHHHAQELSLLVDVHGDAPHVLHEFGELVRDAGIDVPITARPVPLRRLRKVVQRRRQVGSARSHAARRGEPVRRPEGRGLQLKLRPPGHFLAGEHQRAVLGGVVDRRQHGARQVRGGDPPRPAAAAAGRAVRVQRDDGFVFSLRLRLRRYVRAGAPARDDGIPPPLLVREAEPGLRLRTVDVRHPLADYLRRAHRPDGRIPPVAQLQLVLEERHRRAGRLAELVFAFLRYQELRCELHPFGDVIARAPEETPHVAAPGIPASHR